MSTITVKDGPLQSTTKIGAKARSSRFPTGWPLNSDAWDGQTLSLSVEWFLRSCARSACAGMAGRAKLRPETTRMDSPMTLRRSLRACDLARSLPH